MQIISALLLSAFISTYYYLLTVSVVPQLDCRYQGITGIVEQSFFPSLLYVQLIVL